MTDKPVKKSKAAAQQVVRDALNGKIKILYDEIARQEVPQRFLDLLQELDKTGEHQE